MKEVKVGNEIFDGSEESFHRCIKEKYKEYCKKNDRMWAFSDDKHYIYWIEEVLYHKGTNTFDEHKW